MDREVLVGAFFNSNFHSQFVRNKSDEAPPPEV